VTRAILDIKRICVRLMHERHAVSLQGISIRDREWRYPCQIVGWLCRHDLQLPATGNLRDPQRYDLLHGQSLAEPITASPAAGVQSSHVVEV